MDVVKINISKIRKDDSSVDGNALASFFKTAGAMVAGRREMIDGATQIIMQIAGLSEKVVVAKLQEFLSPSATCKPAKEYIITSNPPTVVSKPTAEVAKPVSKPHHDEFGVEFSEDGKTLIRCPEDRTGEYIVPDGVTTLGQGAFENCAYMTSIRLGDSVKKIDKACFFRCKSLVSIKFGKQLKTLGEKAFYECWSLSSIELPDGVQNIKKETFYDCESLVDIKLGRGVQRIAWGALNGIPTGASVILPEQCQCEYPNELRDLLVAYY